MAGTNDFLTFAAGGSANVLSQVQYAARGELANGVSTGQAASPLYNKHARQASIMASMLGQFIALETGLNVVDDGTTSTILNNFILAIQGATRHKLVGVTNFYVNPSSGSDLNFGLTPATAFATPQGALGALYNYYDFAGATAVVNLANGNYVSSASGTPAIVVAGRPVGAPCTAIAPIAFVGNNASPGSVSIQGTNANAVLAVANGALTFSGCSFSSTGSGLTGSGLSSQQSGNISVIGPTSFGSCGGPQVFASDAGFIGLSANYTINGNGGSHLSVIQGGRISVYQVSATTVGNPSFAVFANAESNGVISVFSSTYAGNATGANYRVVLGGRIGTGSGGNPTFFPGSVAGTSDSVSSYA